MHFLQHGGDFSRELSNGAVLGCVPTLDIFHGFAFVESHASNRKQSFDNMLRCISNVRCAKFSLERNPKRCPLSLVFNLKLHLAKERELMLFPIGA